MKLIAPLLCAVLLLNISCNKNKDSIAGTTYEMHFTLDGVKYSKVFSKGTPNYISGLGYAMASGVYFIPGSAFDFQNSSSLYILVGSLNDTRYKNDFATAYQSFYSNYAPGNKAYDHLQYGVQLQPGKVEIRYFDENKVEWSSTTYSGSSYTPTINQPTGKFNITLMRGVNGSSSLHRDLIFVGTFNCKLYQVNGPGVKDLQNGTFQALAEF